MKIERKRKSAGWVWFAGILGVLVLGVLANVFLAAEPALLGRASRLVPTAAWVEGYGGYFWESNRVALTFRGYTSGVRAVRVDTVTGMETPCEPLSQDLLQAGSAEVVQWRLSPDGHYLIWRKERDLNAMWIVSDLEGRRLKTWKTSPTSSSPLWLPGNRRWVEHMASPSGGIQAVIHDLDGPDTICALIQGPFNWPLGVTPSQRIVTFDWAQYSVTQKAGQINWYEYPLSAKPQRAIHYSVPLPKNATALKEAELSPEGDRIACLVHYSYLSPLERMTQRYFRMLPIHEHQKIGLWIIRRDGGGMKLIGAEEGDGASGLLWLPNGRRVSFYDHNMLYSVPVD